MDSLLKSVVIALFATLVSIRVVDAALHSKITFWGTSVFSDDTDWTYLIDYSQRCYSVSCICCTQTSIKWMDLPEVAKIVFFEREGCSGATSGSYTSETGWLVKGFNSGFDIGSFMIMESGMYPTRGIVNLCPVDRPDEKASWDPTSLNSTRSSGSSVAPSSNSPSASSDWSSAGSDGTVVAPA